MPQPLPQTFDVIRNDPEWGEFFPREQARIRAKWVQNRLIASGKPQDPELKAQLTEDAYRDAPEWQKPYQPKSFYPSAGEIPGEMWRLAGRLFTTPQQFLQASFRQPVDRPVSERIADPFKHAFEYAIGEPEATEKYPYTLYTDPLLAKAALSLGKYAVTKGPGLIAGAISKQIPTIRKIISQVGKGRIRPPGTQQAVGETAEAFNTRMMAEETTRREALKGRIREMKAGEETIGPVKPLPPTPRGPYNRAMPKLTPHFPKEEAQKVAEFAARHSDDILSKEILGKGPLSPKVISEIERRIFNRIPKPPVPPPPTVGKASVAKESTVEELNRPGGLADVIAAMGD